MSDFAWTKPAHAALDVLWKDGASASSCANILARRFGGSLSRSAVIGKVHRLHLHEKYPRERAVPARVQVRRPRAPRQPSALRLARLAEAPALAPIAPPRPAPVAEPAPEPRRVAFLDLKPEHCRWPLGDPRAPDFACCGLDRTEPSSYCPYHTRLALGG